MAKFWMSTAPHKCDVCSNAIGTAFVDGRTTMGPWACMCLNCHRRIGVGLGTGKGQQYNFDSTAKEGERWVKQES